MISFVEIKSKLWETEIVGLRSWTVQVQPRYARADFPSVSGGTACIFKDSYLEFGVSYEGIYSNLAGIFN